MTVRHATDRTFMKEIESGTVFVDFWAPWCGPCRMIAPVLEEVDQEIGDKIKIMKVNVDENPEVAQKYGIMSIPTMLLFKNGEPYGQISGYQPKEALIEILGEHI